MVSLFLVRLNLAFSFPVGFVLFSLYPFDKLKESSSYSTTLAKVDLFRLVSISFPVSLSGFFPAVGSGKFQTEAFDVPVPMDLMILNSLAHLTIISTLLITLYLIIPRLSLTTFLIAGISHTLSCIGDLAITVFLSRFRDQKIIIIDHSTSRSMRFYQGKTDKS